MKENDARVVSLIEAGGSKVGTFEDRRNVYDKCRASQGLSKEERIERSQERGMCFKKPRGYLLSHIVNNQLSNDTNKSRRLLEKQLKDAKKRRR